MGRRLGEFTRNNTKCMVEVNGVRLIDRLLGQLARLDLSRVVIVVGYEGAKLKEYLAGDQRAAIKAAIAEKCPDISQTTIQRTLNDLVADGEILKIGGGRYTAYMWNHEKE